MISLIAKVTDIHIVKGWLSFPRFKSIVEEAYLTACTLNGKARCWAGTFRCGAGLLKIESAHLSIIMGAK